MIHTIFSRPSRGYATIALSPYRSAQGPVLREYRDGRVMIDTGCGPLTGRPLGQMQPRNGWLAGFARPC